MLLQTHCCCVVQAGAFRIGDTAGTLENIVSCKLYRPGSVGFVSKSGGLSNECYNVLSRVTDGLCEGVLRICLEHAVISPTPLRAMHVPGHCPASLHREPGIFPQRAQRLCCCGHAGIAIGGDVFPGSTLSDHCCRYQNIKDIKMIVVLGELGGTDEYSLVNFHCIALKERRLMCWAML